MSYRGLLKQARSAVVIACGVALLGGVLPVFAQTTTSGDGGAGNFAGSNPPPPLGDPNQVVPGAGGNTSGWTGYSSDPNRLISAGEANAPGNEYLQVIGGGSVNAARYDLSNNDDWLKKSLDLLGDPGNEVGDLTGDANTSCQQETTQVTREEKSLYTCETATPVTNQPQSCTRIYKPEFDTDYVYQCQAGNQWRSETRTCEPERIVTVDEDYVYSCKTGTVWTHTPASCERRRIIVVDEDYQYGCVQTWNGSTHAPNAACNANGQPGCVPSGGRVCAAPSGLPSSYVCQQGTIGTSEQRSCSKVYETTVSYPYYEYIVDDLLTSRPPATGFNTQAVRDQLAADIAAATNGCRMPPLVQAGSAGVSFTKLGKFNGVDVFRFNPGTIECPAPLAGYTVPFTLTNGNYKVSTTDASTAPLKLYKFDVRASPRRSPQVSGSYGPGCASLGADTTCTKLSEDCPGGETTRIVNGVSITACWERREIYQCGTSQTLPGCSAPAGMALSGETCLATNSGGACTATERTYTDPSGGCSRYEQSVRCEDQAPGAGTPSQVIRDVVSDTWDNGCNALAGNGACVKQGEVVLEGNQTRTINGLPVTRNPWTVREDYICSSSSNVNSCTPFVGCTQQAETCSSRDRAGNCTAYDRTYRCENPANGGGTPIETPRDVVGEYWTDPCATNRNDPACRLTANEVVIGNETRVINGLSVTRNPWKRRESWTCDRSTAVNTCAPVASCQLIGQSCAGTAPDGSCSLQLNRYRCENPVPNEPVVETPIDWTGGGMHENACPSQGNGACTLTSTTCSQPGQTRIVNGVPVTPPCWEETDTYTCETMGQPGNNCSPPSGCEMKEQVCLDDVPAAQCRAWENVYECKKDVVTEETRNSCQTRVCIGDMCVGNEDEGDSDMPDALAALLIAQMAGEDYEKDLTIFKGQPMRCRKAVLGFRNCCKDSGWGVDLGLTQCSEEEKTLMTRQEAKATHYVGTYCSQKSFFGICTEKAMRYCAFEGTLAKIVHEAGRPQIGKGWGTPKDADCSGFTVEQFQQLDLSNVDFSEFTAGLMDQISTPDAGGTVGRIQQSIESLMGNGSPGPGETNEAGGGQP